MDVELREYLENLNIKIDELKLSIIDTRREFNERLVSLEARFDDKLTSLESRFDAKLEALENRFDAKLNEKTEEFKRYVGILSEEFQSKISTVIEGLEILHSQMNEFKQENTREHKELHAMIKLTYSDLNYRLKSLESLHNN